MEYMLLQVCQNLTKDASQRKSASAHPFNQPNAQQSKQEICERCYSHQPDGQLVITYSRHLQNGGTVVPTECKGNIYINFLVLFKPFLQVTCQVTFLWIDSFLTEKQEYNHIAFSVLFLTSNESMSVWIFEQSQSVLLHPHIIQ